MSNYIGLNKKDAEKKLNKYGPNEIREISKTTPLKILLRQIKSNFVLYFLFFAMILSFFVNKELTAYTILVIILVIIISGFVQEYHAEKAIDALKNMLIQKSIVIRDGKQQEVLSKDLVPEDIILLRIGDKIPADCLILEERELRVNESVLTGESKEISKVAGIEGSISKINMIYMGTYIVNGKCTAKIMHTGMNTKFGKIASLISTSEKELLLQKKVNKLTKYIVLIGLTVSFLTGGIMLMMETSITDEVIVNILIVVIALAVSSFPEAFPVVLITTLSSGAYRMAKQNAVVNRMSVIETLGETTIICSDKTGTITKGEMTVKELYSGDVKISVSGTGYGSDGDFYENNKKINISEKYFYQSLFNNLVLCNDANIEKDGDTNEFKTRGSPTESALLILAAKSNLYKEDLNYERMEELPFNSERKTMSVLYQIGKEKIIYSKGAPEYLIKNCTHVLRNNRILKLTSEEKEKLLEINKNMTNRCLRTLAFAEKKVSSFSKDMFDKNLILTGLVGMEDPPREEIKETIQQCRTAGIKVKMITGDNKETALSISKEIGLDGKLMEGYQLEEITDEELSKIINEISIFARVKPEHKLRIVKALKFNGEIVLMTGDGVNDAPALKEANIGVAMGKNGTDVSRSVADLTLKDDNFSTIVYAIKEGRTIFKNIRKFVTYQLSCNFTELAMIFIGVLLSPYLGWGVPILLALHILFMNLVTADIPAIALGLNPVSKDCMTEKPRKKTNLLNKNLIILLLFTGSLLTILVLSSYFIMFNVLGRSLEYARTVALFTLIWFEIVLAFNFRSFRKGVLNKGIFINPYLFYASVVSMIATLMIIYTPANIIFETIPIGIDGFIISMSFAFLLTLIFDGLKYLNKKRTFLELEHA